MPQEKLFLYKEKYNV